MPYVRHLMRVLRDDGHVVAALDWRGLGASGPLTATTCTPRPYCAACDEDIKHVLCHLRERLPNSPLCAIGFSLGGGMLLKYMGDSGDGCLLQAAMAVSPSLDFHANYKQMSQGLSRFYYPLIILPLVAYLFHHRRALGTGDTPISFARDVLTRLRGPHGLDEVYAHLWGMGGGVDQYHEHASAVRVLDRICRRTLIVHAADDPIVPAAAMPLAAMEANPHIVTAITRHGGHMGYTAGVTPLAHTWTDRLLVHFLNHVRDSPSASRGPSAPSSTTRTPSAAASSAATSAASIPVFAVPSSRL